MTGSDERWVWPRYEAYLKALEDIAKRWNGVTDDNASEECHIARAALRKFDQLPDISGEE